MVTAAPAASSEPIKPAKSKYTALNGDKPNPSGHHVRHVTFKICAIGEIVRT